MWLKDPNFNRATFDTLSELSKQSDNFIDLLSWLHDYYKGHDDYDRRKITEFFVDNFVEMRIPEDHWVGHFGFGKNIQYLHYDEKGEEYVDERMLVTDVGILLLKNYIDMTILNPK